MRKYLIGTMLLVIFMAGSAWLFSQGPTITPNIGLQIPAFQQSNWQVPINFDLAQLDLYLSGNLAIPALTVTGAVTPGSVSTTGAVSAGSLALTGALTTTNCTSSASPAVCGASTAGAFAIAAAASSVVVNASKVTANSDIPLTFSSALGTRLGVTCNTTAQQPYVTAISAGVSFTVSVPSNFTTNPGCFMFVIVN